MVPVGISEPTIGGSNKLKKTDVAIRMDEYNILYIYNIV